MTGWRGISLPGLDGRTAVVTGGGGAICGAIAEGLAAQGCRVALWDLSEEAAAARARAIQEGGGAAIPVACDVLDAVRVRAALAETTARIGGVDILVNGAGGSRREATTSPDLPFFDILPESLSSVMSLNWASAVIPCQAVGRLFAERGSGVVLNIASIAGERPLSRSVGYSNGKAALVSFTRWLATHMAREYSPRIRVNALAPGFVLTEQNRFLLEDGRGGLTDRGRTVLERVPMARFGQPEEMAGPALMLVSDASSFVTGAVLAVDGGFTADPGV
jgi:NAD(P)-dependent dehydrogenase (short-subunit alcohol dehydrogenase family)